MTEIGDDWPLISYILDDSEYKATYEGYLEQFVDEVFTVDKMTEAYETYDELIKEYAYQEVSGYSFLSSDSDYDSAVETLKSHVVERNAALESYLEE